MDAQGDSKAMSNKLFREWVETWAKKDLSACRLGWDAAVAALVDELMKSGAPVLRSEHEYGTGRYVRVSDINDVVRRMTEENSDDQPVPDIHIETNPGLENYTLKGSESELNKALEDAVKYGVGILADGTRIEIRDTIPDDDETDHQVTGKK